MENFQEGRDFELATVSQFESLMKLNHDYTYVVVKDSADYSNDKDEDKLNRIYYFVIKNNNPKFIKSCLEFAISRLLPSLVSYQAEVYLKE
jgi:hypothetical protein